jgi:hypothetical protein
MKHFGITPSPKPFELDLDNLLHPVQAFAHPRDVVHDSDLALNEKRAILASWASDACAVEATPTLRWPRYWRRGLGRRDPRSATLDKQVNDADRIR